MTRASLRRERFRRSFPSRSKWSRGQKEGGLIQSLKESYRSQYATRRLVLEPFLVPLKKGIAALPSAERRRLWYQTGAYLRSNAWQIAFFLDFLVGKEAKGGLFLALHDRFMERLINNRRGNCIAATLVWFRLALLASRS